MVERGWSTVKRPSSTLVLGLGNPLLGDDGVGWRVAEECKKHLSTSPTEVDSHAGGGLSLMERLVGYDRVIIIDAVRTGQEPLGSVRRLRIEDLINPAQGHFTSAHDTSLQTALELGRALGACLPSQIEIVAVETEGRFDFCKEFSTAVAAAVPHAVQLVLQIAEDQSQMQSSADNRFQTPKEEEL